MSPKKSSLKKYYSKRNLEASHEPSAHQKVIHKHPLFVVQKHSARSLHYDFRFEDQGVLKSWAIPKGPSTNPKDKRLAIRTEDHPLAYGSFEGVIPEGNYGAGPVMIWDTGTFKNLKDIPLSQCIDNGDITLWLEGTKLKGGYALIKTQLHPKENWILIKMNDIYANKNFNLVTEQPDSTLTGRTINEIKDSDTE